jgi:hypothetical protein
MRITKYGRYWAIYDQANVLVCVCVSRKGALEVVRRLQGVPSSSAPAAGSTTTRPLGARTIGGCPPCPLRRASRETSSVPVRRGHPGDGP